MLFKFFGLPFLIALGIVGCGGLLALAPQRAVKLVSDAFAVEIDFATRGHVKKTIIRIVGAAVIGYGLYIGVHAVTLLLAYQW